MSETLASESHATVPEALATLAAIAALVAAALRPARGERMESARAPCVRTTLAISFLVASVHSAAPETWAGFAIALLAAATGGWLLLRAARSRDWGIEQVAAVAIGALLSRGALAFLYYPVVGETSAGQKYAHNVVMLSIVTAAGAYAIRQARNPRSTRRSLAT